MLTKEQIMSVKARGFLRNRGTDCFSGRVVTVAGVFTPNDLHTVAECAERFGSGKVGFTSRLSAEIVGIPFDKIPCGNRKNSVETLVDTFFLGLQGIATVFHNPQPLQQL